MRTIVGRSYKSYSHNDFVGYILNIDWTFFDTNSNVDDKWSIMDDSGYLLEYL